MDLVETGRFLDGFDTVECCFPDTWGIFVGRRMPAPVFLQAAEQTLAQLAQLPGLGAPRSSLRPPRSSAPSSEA